MSDKLLKKLGYSEQPWTMMLNSSQEITVRNKGGILCTFWKPTKCPTQPDRYERETKESFLNANLVLASLEMLEALIEIANEYEQEIMVYPAAQRHLNTRQKDLIWLSGIFKKATGKLWPEIKELNK